MCLIRWLEHEGVSYDVVTDLELHERPHEALRGYRVVMTGAHPEYWSAPMLDGLDAYFDAQGRFIYWGGNGFYWVTGIAPRRRWAVEVRRGTNGTRTWDTPPGEHHLEATGEPGGLWRYRDRSPQELVGVRFIAQGYGSASPYRRTAASYLPQNSFVFAGLDSDVIGESGTILGAAGGFEMDGYDATAPPARGVVDVLATATEFSEDYDPALEDLFVSNQIHYPEMRKRVRSDVVLFRHHGGAVVFSVGSISWCGSLVTKDCSNDVARVTHNVISRFLDPQPL
jgi:N,N-dimethylformamidase